MSGIVSLVPNKALCTDNAQIAQRLEEVAAKIRAGEWPHLRRVLLIFDADDDVEQRCYGQPTTNAEMVGVLEYAKRKVMG